MKFRKKPVEIEAVQWTGDACQLQQLEGFFDGNEDWFPHHNLILIRTLEGQMTAGPGDWIIKGVEGEFYPCKSCIFEKTYEPVEN